MYIMVNTRRLFVTVFLTCFLWGMFMNYCGWRTHGGDLKGWIHTFAWSPWQVPLKPDTPCTVYAPASYAQATR